MKNKYKIAMYKLFDEDILKIKSYFCRENDNLSDKFEFIEIKDFDMVNKLKEHPNVLLVNVNIILDKNIEKYCRTYMIRVIKFTHRPICVMTSNELLLSLSDNLIKEEILDSGYLFTHFDYSMKVLEEIARISEDSKNKCINQNLIDENIKQSLIKENKGDFLGILLKLVYLIDSKDTYTKVHSENVAKYAVMLGKKLKLDKSYLELLKIGGLLHDIGKVGIPDDILKKKQKLSKTDFEIIKRHPLIGEALLPVSDYMELRQMIRSHHERIDGTGYPDGLKDKTIPYLAKIISIADAFDAMTTKRVYNEVKSFDEAIDELRKCSIEEITENGSVRQQLDTELVNTFIEALYEEKELFFANTIKVYKKTD